jgi:hypothetical protein
MERGPLGLVSKTEELLEKSSGFGLEIRDYGLRESVTLTTSQPLSGRVGTNFAHNPCIRGSSRSAVALSLRNAVHPCF